MNTSTIFKAAHALTKATIQTGDSYSATFAICLKVIYAESKNKITFNFADRRKARCTFKKSKSGKSVIEVIVGSDAHAMFAKIGLEADILFPRSPTMNIKIENIGEAFEKLGDFNNKYQYVYFKEM